MFLLKLVRLLYLVLGVIGCNNFEHNLIHRIYNESDSVTSVVFIGFENNEFLHNFLAQNDNIPVIIFTSPPRFYHKEQFYRNAILVVQYCDKIGYIFSNLIRYIRVRKNVIIISDNIETMKSGFNYFQRNNFTRIFGTDRKSQYAFLPYSNNPVQEISQAKPLPNPLENLNGYVFRAGVQYDSPRVFWYSDKSGQTKIAGYAGELFLNFLQKHNATIEAIFIKNFKSQFTYREIITHKMDVKMVAWNGNERVRLSYPLARVGWVIMVPLNGHLNPNQYFLRPFSLTSWICIGISFVFIVFMDLLKDRLTEQPVNTWKCTARTVLTLLNMPANGKIHRAYRFHCQVMIFSFVLVNLYLISLTSFLTVFIKVKQYDTIEELIDNNVPMMVSPFGYEIVLSKIADKGIEKILKKFDEETVLNARTYYTNTSYAYANDIDSAEFFLKLHAKYSKPKYHLIRESYQDHFIGFLQNRDSPFIEILDRCIIQSMSGGLLDKWTSDAVEIVRQGKFVQRSTGRKILRPLTIDHLQFAWTVHHLGVLFSVVVFLIERYKIFRKCFL
ncbi:uncharacterized protein LOC129912232 [Episyrphus balteatus]|uniref:uncharacterized protein LOC129912232 n=1 Tax=Episyrphus balteatus TaxID=286459 RepID=UPI0024851C28|nr:uncharacterized protein LOC129912232 [Episyrphus balteatus]